MPQDSVARLTCALPLYQLKSMIHDHDLDVTHAGIKLYTNIYNMQMINLIHIHIQKTGELKRKACTIK